MRRLLYFAIVVFASFCLLEGCELSDGSKRTSVELQFSTDTVAFDTLLSTIGSVTKELKVYNRTDDDVIISRVRLADVDSPYRLNVDGVAGSSLDNVEVAANDSMYVFVEVTPTKNGSSQMVELKDSILFEMDDHVQDVKLNSWSQDFVELPGGELGVDLLTADLPYLIDKTIVVPRHSVLTIEAGAKLYFGKDAGLVVDGGIVVNGSVEQPVLLRGKRLGRDYFHVPDQWNGIELRGVGTQNLFENVRVMNAHTGIFAKSDVDGDRIDVVLNNCVVLNSGYVGFYAVNADCRLQNCVIADCGYNALVLLAGGVCSVYHSTIVSYWRWAGHVRTGDWPAVWVGSEFEYRRGDELVTLSGQLDHIEFHNCIITGSLSDELGVEPEAISDYMMFVNCLIDSRRYVDDDSFLSCIFNEEPKFVDRDSYVFELDSLSPAIDSGNVSSAQSVPFDLLGNSRVADEGADLGAYEKIEKE